MRKLLLLSGVASLLAAACLSKSDTPPGAALPDGGLPEGSVSTLPDGALPTDAGLDAFVDPTKVTVTVTRDGAPLAGAIVVFHDSTGAVIDSGPTDATGRATHAAVAQMMVTAATEGVSSNGSVLRNLVTFVGVEGGDNLVVFAPPATNTPAPVTMNVPSNPPAASSLRGYTGASDCQAFALPAATTVTASFRRECANATVTYLEVAFGLTGTPTGYSFLKGQPLPTGATNITTMPAWSTAMGSFSVNVTNAGSGSWEAGFRQIADGAPNATSRTFLLTGGAGNATFPTYTGYPEALQSEVMVVTPNLNRASVRAMSRRAANTATSESYDGSQMMPEITAVTVDSATVERPLTSWTAAAPLSAADGGAAILRWTEYLDASYLQHAWIMVVPPGSTSQRAPALPPALAGFAPATPSVTPFVGFVESDLFANYAEVRAKYGLLGFPDYQISGFGMVAPTLPANGHMDTTMNSGNPG